MHMSATEIIYKEEENRTDVTNKMYLIKEYLAAKYIRHGDGCEELCMAVLMHVILRGSVPIEQLTQELMKEPSMDRKK